MKRYDIFYADEIRETIDGDYVLAKEALALENENFELLRKLAAYEAQPTLDIMQVKPGEWERLIAVPITSEHLDRLLKGAKNAALEEAAMVCDRFQARDVGMQPAECAGAIRAMKEQP